MEINRLYIWVCFFFCLALTAGGMLLLFRFQEYKKIPAFRFIQYFLILMYTFGFYAMWSDVFFRILFKSLQKYEDLATISGFMASFGVPFLLAGLLMMILWAFHLLQQKPGYLMLIVSGIMSGLVTVAYLTLNEFKPLEDIRQLYALLFLFITVFTALLLAFYKIRYLKHHHKLILSLLVLFSGAVHLLLFTDWINIPLYELIFILLFFLSNTGLVVYFLFTVQLPAITEEKEEVMSFEVFIQRYGITARESEIVMEIYQGKTNKEIADTLFVTVQTIKDHTHRIYQKTNVKNRTQLASLLRKFN